ncbi:signal peptidase I [Paenibacillus sp. N1-5-1-14]|uniref:signal peptidase I n=1 Tax=Paenibacillus radicibacter TaxID=2972488 RepID=UPI002158EDAE|nr:signal peptidase I [Paenibacillus radicibacter]MCR8641771.1 signal peptidase I [Paenibacillus radicibacter]
MERNEKNEPTHVEESNASGEGAAPNPTTSKWKKETWEWAKALLIAVVIVVVLRGFLFEPFKVSGPSMEPNFFDAERLIVNKITYTWGKPKQGDVVVFKANAEEDYIKRVIGLPGDTVKVDGDKVFVNGKELDEPYLKTAIEKAQSEGHPYNTARNFAESKVPDGKIFVLGDHRPVSKDSRFEDVGFVDISQVVGRADVIFWPLDKFSLVD